MKINKPTGIQIGDGISARFQERTSKKFEGDPVELGIKLALERIGEGVKKDVFNLSIGELQVPENIKLKLIVSKVKEAVNICGNKEKVQRFLEMTRIEELKRISNIINKNPTLSDIFGIDIFGNIFVRNYGFEDGNSKLLSGHFPLEGLTVTQGVALRQLYEEISGVKPNKDFNTRFVEFPQKGIIPGTRLKVIKDGIVLENGERILKYELQEGFVNPKDFDYPVGEYSFSLINPENLVLHAGSARVFDKVSVSLQEEGKLTVGDIFEGSYNILNLGELLDKDGNFNQTFLDEIAAQVASAGFSYIENGDLLKKYGVDAKKQNNFRLLTYKNTKNTIVSYKDLKVGDEINVGVIMTGLNIEKGKIKSIEANYIVYTGETILQTGKIEGLNVAVRIVRMGL